MVAQRGRRARERFDSADDLRAAITDREATVVRVLTDRDQNVRDHDALHAAVAAALA